AQGHGRLPAGSKVEVPQSDHLAGASGDGLISGGSGGSPNLPGREDVAVRQISGRNAVHRRVLRVRQGGAPGLLAEREIRYWELKGEKEPIDSARSRPGRLAAGERRRP